MQYQVEYEVWDARNGNTQKGYSEKDAKQLAERLNHFVIDNMGLPFRVMDVVGPFYARRVR